MLHPKTYKRFTQHLALTSSFVIALSSATISFGAGEETELTYATKTVSSEADAAFTDEEFKDMEGYFKHLATKAKEEANSPEKHVWNLLTPGLRADLTRWENEPKYTDQKMRATIVKAMTDLCRRDDLYQAASWQGFTMSTALSTRWAFFNNLEAVDKARFNRELLHEMWPTYLAEPTKPTEITRQKALGNFFSDYLDLGDRFLGQGDLKPGFKVPILGAVWQPNFFFWGGLRSRLQYFDDGAENSTEFSEWANRLDFNFNLALTPTERLVVTFTPLHQGLDATGYQFDDIPGREEGFEDYLNGDPNTFFLEGDFGELVPALDPGDGKGLDFGFAVGRQPIRFQRGFMVDDELDALGIVRNNQTWIPGSSNLRTTGLYAWNEIDRNGGIEDNDANLFGLFNFIDFPKNTVNIDYMFVSSGLRARAPAPTDTATEEDDGSMAMADTAAEDPGNFGGDSHHIGISSVQRIGLYSTSIHANASLTDDDTRAVGEGFLLFGDISYTPPFGKDVAYATAFVAIDDYSAVRRPLALGPLAPVGILFEGPGIGRVGAPLSNLANEVAGGALGYQWINTKKRVNITAEIAARIDTASGDAGAGDSFAAGVRYQKAYGKNWILRGDAAIATQDEGDDRVVAGADITYQF